MAIEHKISYLRRTNKGVERRTETKKLTRSLAIKLKCLDCSMGAPEEVRQCCMPQCPLYPFRPYQAKASKRKRVQVLRPSNLAVWW